MLLAEHAAEPGVRGQAFNVTADVPISVLDLVNMIVRVSGSPDLEPIVESADLSQKGTYEHLSNEKIKQSLGWQTAKCIRGWAAAIGEQRHPFVPRWAS